MNAYRKDFADNFRSEFYKPEYQDDLDDIKQYRHLGPVVQRTDVLDELSELTHDDSPFSGALILKPGHAGHYLKYRLFVDQIRSGNR